jgi:TPR repeat protein
MRRAKNKTPSDGSDAIDSKIPDQFMCPISYQHMTDPVMTAMNQTYDRKSIQQWFDQGNASDPLTGVILKDKILIPNNSLKTSIDRYIDSYRNKLIGRKFSICLNVLTKDHKLSKILKKIKNKRKLHTILRVLVSPKWDIACNPLNSVELNSVELNLVEEKIGMSECMKHHMKQFDIKILTDVGMTYDDAKLFINTLNMHKSNYYYKLGQQIEEFNQITKMGTDQKLAYDKYYMAMNMGHNEATIRIGLYHMFGYGVQSEKHIIDYNSAFKMFIRCKSDLWLGYCYAIERGTITDLTLAEKYLSKCKCSISTWLLACIKNTQHNGLNSQIELMYKKGFDGLIKDETDSRTKLYERSILQFFIAMSYRCGYGTQKNNETAYQWYQRSAWNGNVDGNYNIAVMLYDKIGCERNIIRAIDEYKKCASQGHPTACAALATVYFDVKCSDYFKNKEDRNDTICRLLLYSGIDCDDKHGLYVLGHVYEWGKYGFPADIDQSVKYYEKSAEQGHENALKALGRLKNSKK